MYSTKKIYIFQYQCVHFGLNMYLNLVKQILDLEVEEAQKTLDKIKSKYPIAITRDLKKAKEWLKNHARGSERYGIVVSSQAERLKPHAIDVRSPMDPIHWFLDSKKMSDHHIILNQWRQNLTIRLPVEETRGAFLIHS